MKRRSPVRHSPARQLARACQSLPELRDGVERDRGALTHTHTHVLLVVALSSATRAAMGPREETPTGARRPTTYQPSTARE
eukprot:7999967-Pyramimonas_sp.AAC.1